jgi:hypothetical protein
VICSDCKEIAQPVMLGAERFSACCAAPLWDDTDYHEWGWLQSIGYWSRPCQDEGDNP